MKRASVLLILFFISFKNLFASDSQEFVNKVFAELDVNKDGIIDKADLQKFSKNEFEKMNINNDGLISKEEFFDFVCKKSCANGNCECNNYADKENLYYLKEYWQKLDKDQNGFITQQEKLEDDLQTFYNLDVDGDGKVKKEDVEAQLY